jgi:hypothetical protein
MGSDQDLAIATAFDLAPWPDDTMHTFSCTLTFHQPGDVDADGHVDAADFAAPADCLGGPDVGLTDAACETFGFLCDDAVDLEDDAILPPVFTGRGG